MYFGEPAEKEMKIQDASRSFAWLVSGIESFNRFPAVLEITWDFRQAQVSPRPVVFNMSLKLTCKFALVRIVPFSVIFPVSTPSSGVLRSN